MVEINSSAIQPTYQESTTLSLTLGSFRVDSVTASLADGDLVVETLLLRDEVFVDALRKYESALRERNDAATSPTARLVESINLSVRSAADQVVPRSRIEAGGSGSENQVKWVFGPIAPDSGPWTISVMDGVGAKFVATFSANEPSGHATA
jgi:hypothetical protein